MKQHFSKCNFFSGDEYMKKIIILIILIPGVLFAQAKKQSNSINEDRVKLMVNEEVQKSEDRLQKQLSDTQTNMNDKISQRVDGLQQELNFYKWLTRLFSILFGGSIVGIVAGIWGTIKYVTKYVMKRVRDEVDFAVYKLDPRKWPIRIPRENFDSEHEHLKSLKYVKLIQYEGLDFQTKEGIVIYRVKSDEDLEDLNKIIELENIQSLKCCFVIYYTGKENLNHSLLKPDVNFVISRMVGSLSNQIFAASRNII